MNSSSYQHSERLKTERNRAPSRLIDVMQGDVVRIVKTEGQSLQYVILSYC